MRKLLFFLFSFIVFPFIFVWIAGFFYEDISIGGRKQQFQQCYMGKIITLERQGLQKSIDVEEYVLGVLPGVIPSNYCEEAIMCQAVVVRTNVLKEMEEKKTEDANALSYHYLSEEERKELFGSLNYSKVEKLYEKAVEKTAGKVLVWDDELIMAVYHEASMGSTLSAKEVTGEDIPYLQSVDSSQDVEAQNYMQTIEYSWGEMEEILGQANMKKVGVVISDKTDHGVVKEVVVGDKTYSGEEFADKMNIESVIYEVEAIEGGLRFVGIGKGNGMGMSQYGANYMAQQGKTYDDILKYYYSGAVVKQY